jgi:alanine racemase
MSRIGFKANMNSVNDILEISKLSNIKIEGIYTHFSTADEINKEFTYEQIQKYNKVTDELERLGVQITIKHVSNSAAIMDLKDIDYNMVRCGIILYGHYPSDEVKKEKLKSAPHPKISWTDFEKRFDSAPSGGKHIDVFSITFSIGSN